MTNSLEPLEPEEALQMYLSHRENEISDKTYRAHRIRLQHFVRWCREEDIDNMNDITGRDLYSYRLWRTDEGGLNRVSVRTQMSTLKVFIRFCVKINAVSDGLEKAVDVPQLNKGENARSVMLEADRVEKILEYMQKFTYAEFKHVLFRLLWVTGCRIGAARALNVEDVDTDEGYIEIRHRPEYSTPIKNKEQGERFVSIDEQTQEVLSDWLEEMRPDVTDDYGMEPLLASNYGRVATSTIRNNIYYVTCPTFIGEDCECETNSHSYHDAASCPDSVSPHALRRSSITHHLRQEVPKKVVADRCDVSHDVLDEHYNEMTEREKMDQREDEVNFF